MNSAAAWEGVDEACRCESYAAAAWNVANLPPDLRGRLADAPRTSARCWSCAWPGPACRKRTSASPRGCASSCSTGTRWAGRCHPRRGRRRPATATASSSSSTSPGRTRGGGRRGSARRAVPVGARGRRRARAAAQLRRVRAARGRGQGAGAALGQRRAVGARAAGIRAGRPAGSRSASAPSRISCRRSSARSTSTARASSSSRSTSPRPAARHAPGERFGFPAELAEAQPAMCAPHFDRAAEIIAERLERAEASNAEGWHMIAAASSALGRADLRPAARAAEPARAGDRPGPRRDGNRRDRCAATPRPRWSWRTACATAPPTSKPGSMIRRRTSGCSNCRPALARRELVDEAVRSPTPSPSSTPRTAPSTPATRP